MYIFHQTTFMANFLWILGLSICSFQQYCAGETTTSGDLNVTLDATTLCADGLCDVTTTTLPPGFLPPCQGTMDKWNGITYQITQNDTLYWGPCGFPNPFRTPSRCGDIEVTSTTHVCDPDNVLGEQRKELDDLTAAVTEEMPSVTCKRPGEKSVGEKVHVVVAVVQHMRTVDMGQSICQDDCGQVLPYMEPNTREPTEVEINLSSQAFSQVLSAKWELGSCGNDIVVFFVADYGVITGAYGEKAANGIDASSFRQILASGQEMYREDGDVVRALEYVVRKIEQQLGASPLTRGSGPAYSLLAVLLALALLFLVGFGCTYHYGRVSDYWDQQWWEVVIKYIIYLLFGIFIIEWIVHGLVVIESKVRLWWLVIPALGVVLSLMVLGILIAAGYQW